MSNHRPPNDPGPSVVSIVVTGLVTLAVVGLTFYVIWGPLDRRDLLGAAFGTVLGGMLLGQTVARISQRLAAQARIKRWEARQERENVELRPRFSEADRVHVDLAVQHGWPLPEPTGTEPAPYDPGPTTFNAAGWPVPTVAAPVEREEEYAWAAGEPESVAQVLGTPEPEPWRSDETHTFERTGLDDPEATMVREVPPAWTDPTGEVGTETRRLEQYTGQQVHGPSAAALRPIAVPVFRTEVERAAWAGHHGLPPEALPYLPEGWPEDRS